MGEEGRTSVEKRKRAGALDRQEEEPWPVLLRGGENTVESNVGATKMPHQNGATECDVSGFRTTRRTCTVDTSQTKGILSLLASGKKMKEDDKERTKALKRDGDLRKVRRRGKRERTRERKRERAREGEKEAHWHGHGREQRRRAASERNRLPWCLFWQGMRPGETRRWCCDTRMWDKTTSLKLWLWNAGDDPRKTETKQRER